MVQKLKGPEKRGTREAEFSYGTNKYEIQVKHLLDMPRMSGGKEISECDLIRYSHYFLFPEI